MGPITETMENCIGVLERAAIRLLRQGEEREKFWAEMREWEAKPEVQARSITRRKTRIGEDPATRNRRLTWQRNYARRKKDEART